MMRAMKKCAATFMMAVLFTFASTWVANGGGGGAPSAAADDEDEDDRPVKKKKPVKAAPADDDEDADTDADDDEDARPRAKSKARSKAAADDDEDADEDVDADEDADDDARPTKKRKSAWRGSADDEDEDDDEDDADVDDEDDDRPAKKPAKKKAKPAVSDEDDEDDADAADDDEDDRPAKKPAKKKAKPPVDDEDDDDEDDAASGDDDDDLPPGFAAGKKKKRPTRLAEDAEPTDTSAGEVGQAVVPERHIVPPRITITGELLGAKPMDSDNSSLFGMGGGGGLGLEIFLSQALGLHASASFMTFTAGDSMSTTSWASAQVGPRLHLGSKLFGASTHNDAWLDAHASYGTSGGIRRPGFDVGASVQWELSPTVRLGPMVRWAFGSDPLDKNAQLLHVGVAIGLGGRTRQTIHIEGDFDGDGLLDSEDSCRTEAAGDKPDPDRPGCPVRDGDDDGVLDDEDECPEEAQGDTPDPERAGCPKPPVPDSDGDMVLDDVDKCPEQFGAARDDAATNGCPLARVQDQKIEIFEQIFFEHDSATISASSTPVLEAIGKVIGELGDKRISIEGHTSEDGTDKYNLDLSKRRARAVAQWLTDNAGIPASRLETKGWGKKRPLVEGFGADVSKNRRVEFIILEAK